MRNFDLFVKELCDFELLTLKKYRYPMLNKSQQQLLEHDTRRRGIAKSDFWSFKEDYLSKTQGKIRCPQCHSCQITSHDSIRAEDIKTIFQGLILPFKFRYTFHCILCEFTFRKIISIKVLRMLYQH